MKYVFGFLFFLLLALIVILQSPLAHYNVSPSLPYGLYFLDIFHTDLKAGDYVVFEDPLGSGKGFMKRIDHFTDNDDLWVAGDSAEVIRERTGMEGLVSYDSSFFGAVSKSDVKKVFKIYTWD